MLFQGLSMNSTLTTLNLSSNSLGSLSAQTLARVLEGDVTQLRILNLSCNLLQEKDVNKIARSLETNKVECNSCKVVFVDHCVIQGVIYLDLRCNPASSECVSINSIQSILHKNEMLCHASV